MAPGGSTPSLTSAERLASYPPGDTLTQSEGPAWRDVQMSVFSLASSAEAFDMPAVSEPFIVWVAAGEAHTEERELGGAWVSSHIRPGSLFLTMAGAPYSFKWRRLSQEPLEVVLLLLSMPIFEAALQEPLEVVLLLLSMPIFEAALQERYGERAQEAHFRNVSGIDDAALVALMACLRAELDAPRQAPCSCAAWPTPSRSTWRAITSTSARPSWTALPCPPTSCAS